MELNIVISVLNIEVKEVAYLQKVSQLSHTFKSYRNSPVADNKKIRESISTKDRLSEFWFYLWYTIYHLSVRKMHAKYNLKRG